MLPRVLCFLWLAAELAVVWHRPGGKGADRQSFAALWLTIVTAIVIAGFVALSGIGGIEQWAGPLNVIAVVLLLAGAAIRFVAIFVLRRFFTVRVTIVDGHQLIRNGLYKYLRHPAYLGALLCFAAVSLTMHNWISIILVLVPALGVLIYRIKVEERVLQDTFGQEYAAYRRSTWRLFPWVY